MRSNGRRPLVMGKDGQPIRLTNAEQYHAEWCQRQIHELHTLKNGLGAEIDITTLTQIVKKVSQQKFFHVAPADYVPVRVGEGAWSTNLVTYRAFDIAGDFADGVINTGGNNARLASANTGVDAVTVRVKNWAKMIGWTIYEMEQAARAGNWDYVASLERSRKMNWDLGIQQVAFLGLAGENGLGGAVVGLLNLGSQVSNNTTVITKPIKDMTPTELKTFCENVLEVYRANCNRTAWPDRFVIPESDYNGLASQSSPQFPIKSTLQLLQEMFATITQKPGFRILPLAYADASSHVGIAGIDGKQVYALYNYDEESLRMDIPIDYTNTLANSIDNFNFQNVAYGQFTGVGVYRPQEILYFTY